jgi:uncharacterized protein YbbC (DUF1343 family)
MYKIIFLIFIALITFPNILIPDSNGSPPPKITLGIDHLFTKFDHLIRGKRIGLITNHTAVNGRMESTISLMKKNSREKNYTLVALFAPEHGIDGSFYASENISNLKDPEGIPIYSLHGKTRRPTEEMLKNIDLLIFDIQDIGSRSYTYITTLFYAMEEAAKRKIGVIVADRPNPINGITVDGPMLEKEWRSFVGYINVPYCHGMTIGELALYFNREYEIHCELNVIPMEGWKRYMSFQETGLSWIPTSPNIPEPTTPFYYPITGILGELQIVNIGIGYTLPFKLIGAPWINAKNFADSLNGQKFPGVHFTPFYFRPFYGRFAHEECQGVLISVIDPLIYKPVSTQYLILGMLKSLYPKEFEKALETAKPRKEMFCKVNGSEAVFTILKEKKYIVWELKSLHQKEREEFLLRRKNYLIPNYN